MFPNFALSHAAKSLEFPLARLTLRTLSTDLGRGGEGRGREKETGEEEEEN